MADATKSILQTYIMAKVVNTTILVKYQSFMSGEKDMQKQQYVRQSSGAKALRLDEQALLVQHRLLQLLAMILSAATALGLYQIFVR